MNSKHLIGLLIVAAAAVGAYKYSSMSEEDKKKLADTIKNKFDQIKKEAGDSVDTAKGYVDDLRDKAVNLLNEHFPDMKDFFQNIFGSGKESAEGSTPQQA